MKQFVIVLVILSLCALERLQARQSNSNFLRGVFLFGNSGSMNYDTLKNSLHLNAFQVSTGYGYPTVDNALLRNSAGLKVINQRRRDM